MLSTPRQRNSRKNVADSMADAIVQQTLLQHPCSTAHSPHLLLKKQNPISTNAAPATRHHAFLRIALALSVVFGTGLTLTGCGGGDATTRTDTTPAPPPVDPNIRTTYNITVRSPVKLINLKASVADAATGVSLGEATIASGNDLVIAVPAAYTQNGNLVVVTLSPINSTSSYFDPMLKNGQGDIAVFNQPLHAITPLNQSDVTVKIDPFSEIVYQRALTRSGVLITEAPFNIPQLSAANLVTEDFSLASNDLALSLGVSNGSPFVGFINSPSDISGLRIYSTQNNSANPSKVPNSLVSNELLALGQLALYTKNNPGETTPYLNFALRAALDLRDGDLDGMTINGGDKLGTVQISSPILYSGVTATVNNDANRNSIATLLADNQALRDAHGTAVKQAAIQLFNAVDALPTTTVHFDADTLSYIQDFNYGSFSYKASNPVSTRIGAGNFTLAFGLPTGTDLKNLLDASDGSGRANDIMQLNGVYKNSSGCQLNIGYDGILKLSQGNLSFIGAINRKSSDSLKRTSTDNYLLNVTSAELTTPRFTQVRTKNGQVLSATVGRSTQAVPDQLDSIDLNCTF